MLMLHPSFPGAVRETCRFFLSSFRNNPLMNVVMNDRGRDVGALAAVYLHYAPGDAAGDGLTAARFASLCRQVGLCSAGRALAMLTVLEFAGYVAPEARGRAGRHRRLVPTEKLLALHWQRWAALLGALRAVVPALPVLDPAHVRTELLSGLTVELGRRYVDGYRVLHFVQPLQDFAERKAGLPVLFALDEPGAGAEPAHAVSTTGLAKRFGVARAHIRAILAEAERHGLAARDGAAGGFRGTPVLSETLSRFAAALFLLLLRAAQAGGLAGDR